MPRKYTNLWPGVRPAVRNAIAELRREIVAAPGSTFYVDGETGTAGGPGRDWDGAFDTIQAAVDLCGDGTGDRIYVAPHKYQENVVIFEKEALQIIATHPGWVTRIRAGDGATKYTMNTVGGVSMQGFCFVVLSRSVTVDGFLLDGGGNYGGMYVGDGYRIDTDWTENSASARIQNNVFVGGAEGNHALILDGCSDDVQIDGNIFNDWTQAALQIDPGGARTCQNPIIKNNHFIDIASGKKGIAMYSSATTVGIQVGPNNVFADKAGVNGGSCAFANTGVHSFIGNHDMTNAGATGAATDFMGGNSEAHAMNSPLYLHEA